MNDYFEWNKYVQKHVTTNKYYVACFEHIQKSFADNLICSHPIDKNHTICCRHEATPDHSLNATQHYSDHLGDENLQNRWIIATNHFSISLSSIIYSFFCVFRFDLGISQTRNRAMRIIYEILCVGLSEFDIDWFDGRRWSVLRHNHVFRKASEHKISTKMRANCLLVCAVLGVIALERELLLVGHGFFVRWSGPTMERSMISGEWSNEVCSGLAWLCRGGSGGVCATYVPDYFL